MVRNLLTANASLDLLVDIVRSQHCAELTTEVVEAFIEM